MASNFSNTFPIDEDELSSSDEEEPIAYNLYPRPLGRVIPEGAMARRLRNARSLEEATRLRYSMLELFVHRRFHELGSRIEHHVVCRPYTAPSIRALLTSSVPRGHTPMHLLATKI